MRKFVALAVVSLLGVSAAMAGESSGKFELSLFGGISFGASSSSAYARSWSADFLKSASENTNISASRSDALQAGIGLTYYFLPAWGIQLSAAYGAPRFTVASAWGANFNYEGWPTVSLGGDFPSTRTRLTTIPVSLDLVARWDLGAVTLFGLAGPSLFFNSFAADSFSVYGSTYFVGVYPLYGEQWTDFFRIPVRIPKTSWTGVGADFGAGLDVRIVSSFSLTAAARYYLCPAKRFSWSWVTGSYTSFVYGFFVDEPFTDLAAAQNLTTALTVKPSCFSLTAGIKFGF